MPAWSEPLQTSPCFGSPITTDTNKMLRDGHRRRRLEMHADQILNAPSSANQNLLHSDTDPASLTANAVHDTLLLAATPSRRNLNRHRQADTARPARVPASRITELEAQSMQSHEQQQAAAHAQPAAAPPVHHPRYRGTPQMTARDGQNCMTSDA